MASLREIQMCQLDILKAVAEICDRHDIPYYLAYGTLLGAVRHKGFIPWDDDVDIYMKYNDLERFKKICKKELPDKFFYQDPETDIGSHWLFVKIRANGTEMSETYPTQGVHADCHEGIWIDIFPLLDAADTPENLGQQVSAIFEYQKWLLHRQPIKKNMSIRAKLATLRTNIKAKRKLSGYKKIFEKLQSDNSDFMIVLGNCYFTDNTAESRKKALDCRTYKSDLIPGTYSFEDAVFCGPKDYDAYLSRIYGSDYMTPRQWSHLQDYSYVII